MQTVTEGTRRIVARYIRQHPDVALEEVARETGVPLYLVKRVVAMAAAGIRRGV